MLEEDLKINEKYILLRLRAEAETAAMADVFGVSQAVYCAWESGEIEGPAIKIGGLDQWERLIVLRLRAGMTVEELAQRMGVSRQQLRNWERGKGNLGLLMRFWDGC